jgi:UDP-N-acetylglucosamine acyltransferase
MAQIHPTAIVDPGAELDATVTVGPYCVIGPQVVIGAGTSLASHVVVQGRTRIGRDNRIHPFASLGGVPQDKKYAGEPTELHIGDRNTIREFCTFNLGTAQDVGVTRLGDDNWMMAYTHLAHDAQVGSHAIFANNAQVAGHVEVGDWVILGAYTAVHQFVKIGAHAMTGMGTVLLQDVPPYAMVSGNPCEARGVINQEGLRRRGFSAARIAAAKQMHRLLYRSGHTLEEARRAIEALRATNAEAAGDIDAMLGFLARADRGLVR